MKRLGKTTSVIGTVQTLIVCLGLLLTAAGSSPAAARAATTADVDVDVAAMALTPDDLSSAGLEGWGIAGGQMLRPGEVAGRLAFERELQSGGSDLLLSKSGLIEGYELRLQFPGATSELPARAVRSTVLRFADEQGAEAAAEFLANPARAPFAGPVEPIDGLPGQASLVHLEGTTADPFHGLELTIQSGRFVAQVRLVDFTGVEPTAAAVQNLGERLLARIDDADTGAAGMRRQTLEIRTPGTVIEHEFYTVAGGEPRRLASQSAKAAAESVKDDRAAGLVEEFEARQRVPDLSDAGPVWFVFAGQRFEREALASAYLRNSPARAAEFGGFSDVQALPDVVEYGDESIAYTMTLEWGPGQTTYHYLSYAVRVGDRLGWIDLIAARPLPPATLDDLARTQEGCLLERRCDGARPHPDASTDPAGADARTSKRAGKLGRNDAASETTLAIPELGLALTYDPAAWQPQDENWLTPDGIVLFLQDDAGSALSLGLDSESATAGACVAGRTRSLADDEAFGAAHPIGASSGDAVAYGVHLASNNETFIYLECRSLPERDGFAVILQIGPLSDFDLRSADREQLLSGLTPAG